MSSQRSHVFQIPQSSWLTLFYWSTCSCLDVAHPCYPTPSSGTRTRHCSLHYLFPRLSPCLCMMWLQYDNFSLSVLLLSPVPIQLFSLPSMIRSVKSDGVLSFVKHFGCQYGQELADTSCVLCLENSVCMYALQAVCMQHATRDKPISTGNKVCQTTLVHNCSIIQNNKTENQTD